MIKRITVHNKPTLGKEEQRAALRVIRSGWLTQGKEVAALENEFCEFLGLSEGHAVAVATGVAALYLALWALDAKNKTITMPVYTGCSVRNAVWLANAKENLVDNSPDSPNIDVRKIKITNSGIAIVPHMFGIPVDFSSVKKHVDVIEDCAQALSSTIDKIPVGLHGKCGIFSFSVIKLMTAGGHGGMVVSKDKSLIDKIRDFRQYDLRRDKKKRFNFQMMDLQAAIGREQLKKVVGFRETREEIFNEYRSAGLDLLDTAESHIKPIRYRAVLKTNQAKRMQKVFYSKGIRTIIPIERWELLDSDKGKFPNANYLATHTLSLPIYPSLKAQELKAILKILKSFQ